MAETEAPEAPKGKQPFLKRKVAGIPMPVVLIVGGVVAIYAYRKFTGSSTSSSSTATPAASSAAPLDTSGGVTGGGGFTDPGLGTPTTSGQSPTDTSQFTPAPPATVSGTSGVTPLGRQTLTIAGQAFPTTANFSQNGGTFYGISNPIEAKKLSSLGYSLIRNPNDPNGKGLFLYVPQGKTLASIRRPHHKPPAKRKKMARA